MPGSVFIPSTPAPTHPGRFRAGAEARLGIGGNHGGAFLPDLFGGSGRQLIEAAFGADLMQPPSSWTWYDITTDVQWDPGVDISIGSPDETTGIVPGSLAADLRNDQPNGGDYTIGNALSTYGLNVRENTPIRASVDIGTGTSLRFQGYLTSCKPKRGSGGERMVRLQAHGVGRRLKQDKGEAKSAIRRFFDIQPTDGGSAYSGPLAYWSLEDASGSTSAASGLRGGTPMLVAGGSSSGAGARFGASQGRTQPPSTGFEVPRIGAKSFVSLAEGGTLSAVLPHSLEPRYAVQMISFSWSDASDIVLARWFTPGGVFFRYEVINRASGFVEVVGYTTGGGGTGTTLCTTDPSVPIDEWELVVYQRQSGSNVETYFYMLQALTTGQIGYSDFDSRAGTLAVPRHVFLNPDMATADGTAIVGSENLRSDITNAHLAIWHDVPNFMTTGTASSITGTLCAPWNGWIGESATDRMVRLCAEEGIEIDVIGESDVAMGFQDAGTFLSLLQECAKADQGLLLDGLGPGFTYIARTELYSSAAALTFDADGGGDLIGQVDGEHDDLRRVNSYTAKSPDGGERTFTQTGGDLGSDTVGIYRDGDNHSMYIEDDLYQLAAWKVGQGTVPGVRYPRIEVNFAKPVTSAKASAWLVTRPFSRIDVLGIESGTSNPDRSFVVRAWRERWNSRSWPVTYTLAPYDVYAVTVLADSTSPTPGEFTSWLDADADLVTMTDLAAGGTSVTVDVGPTGTTLTHPAVSSYSDDIAGLYINLDGMRVGVTAISSPSGTQQTLTLTGSDVLRRVLPGAPVSAWDPVVFGW